MSQQLNRRALLLALCASACIPSVAAVPLTAHIIAHSHCDPGWLESFEGYYSTQVHGILSSVVDQLSRDRNRRFVWAETSFWMRWYEVQQEETKATVKALVDSGQLEFVGGGWVQNDEANPDPVSVISQLSEGHEYLQALFGKRPSIAWQIDPFGHAASFAAVAASAGYDALVINRIDHTVKDALKTRAAMEFVWRPYAPLPGLTPGAPSYSNASIFTHVLHTHYSAPRGYDFENGEGQPISDYNVASRAEQLVRDLRERSKTVRTPHVLVPFGDDFKFQDAGRQFSNMDRLVAYVNANNGLSPGDTSAEGPFTGVILRYSTLSEYFEAVKGHLRGDGRQGAAADGSKIPPSLLPSIPIPLYTPAGFSDGGADFMPYADNPTSFWTGYYTSRPTLKHAIRRTAAVLRAGEALVAMARPWAGAWQASAGAVLEAYAAEVQTAHLAGADGVQPLPSLAIAATPYAAFSWLAAAQRLETVRLDAALCLHHDAITGTSREGVVNDYTERMATGHEDVLGVTTDVVSLLLGGLAKGGAGGPAPLTHVPHVLPVLPSLSLLLDRHGRAPNSTPSHPFVAYNPSGWARTTLLSVVVDIAGTACAANPPPCAHRGWPFGLVTDEGGSPMSSQWSALVEDAGAAKGAGDEASPAWACSGTRYELSFAATLPPLSLSTFFVTAAWRVGEGAEGEAEEACVTEALAAIGAQGSTAAVQMPESAAAEEESASVKATAPAGLVDRVSWVPRPAPDASVTLENACLALEVSSSTGLLVSVTRKGREGAPPVRVAVKQQFGVYETHNSGAYLFRPLAHPNFEPLAQGGGGGKDVVVSVVTGGAGLVQHVRVVGPRLSQTIRLTDAAGWGRGVAGAEEACSDPLSPDSAFEVIPTLTAGGNQEVVMVLSIDLSLTGAEAQHSGRRTNTRDNTNAGVPAPGGEEPCDGVPPAPLGWWTSDGLGLLRRTPAPADVTADAITRYFYPLNTMTRVSGSVGTAGATAWLSVHSPTPCGVVARGLPDGGTQIQVMLHRQLSQDDGRGLATGVYDTTIITPRLLFTLGAAGSGTPAGSCGLVPGHGLATADAAASGNEDWTWKWSARAVQHTLPLLTMHADLAGLRSVPKGAIIGRGLFQEDKRRLGADGRGRRKKAPVPAPVPAVPARDAAAAAAADEAAVAAAAHLVAEAAAAAPGEGEGVAAAAAPAPQRATYRPPLDAATGIGGVTPAFVLAEAAVPRRLWTAAYSTSWRGLMAAEEGAPAPLPPWLHLLTLQPRDAVTDDVVVRLQNLGGPSATVDISTLLSGPGVRARRGAATACGGALVTSGVRPRSLTLNDAAPSGNTCGLACLALRAGSGRDDTSLAYAGVLAALRSSSSSVRVATARQLLAAGSSHAFALSTKAEMDAAKEEAAGGAAGGVGTGPERQNTEEEGVFISDAAVDKAKKVAAAGLARPVAPPFVPRPVPVPGEAVQRRLLEAPPASRRRVKAAAKKWAPFEVQESVSVPRPFGATLAPASYGSFFLTLTPSGGVGACAGSQAPAPLAAWQQALAEPVAAVDEPATESAAAPPPALTGGEDIVPGVAGGSEPGVGSSGSHDARDGWEEPSGGLSKDAAASLKTRKRRRQKGKVSLPGLGDGDSLELPFVAAGGEELTGLGLLASLFIWLLAAAGLLTLLQAACGWCCGGREKELLPTVHQVEDQVDSLFSCGKRAGKKSA